MNKDNKILIHNINHLFKSILTMRFHLIRLLLPVLILVPLQHTRSAEIFLKCVGKYEIDRNYGTYLDELLQSNLSLIGTCQKGRG